MATDTERPLSPTPEALERADEVWSELICLDPCSAICDKPVDIATIAAALQAAFDAGVKEGSK